MKKVCYCFLLALIVSVLSSCESMLEEVEPIVKTEDDGSVSGGQGGGGDQEEKP